MGSASLIVLSGVLLVPVVAAIADGGFFFLEGQSAPLAQTRQEVLAAFYHGSADGLDRATYVLRSRYTGTPAAFAWVVPVPATPTDVKAHEDGSVFESLDEQTVPRFTFYGARVSGFGCSGGGTAGPAGSEEAGLVHVEASGTAGIFDWTALTSTGGNALLDWLNANGFALSDDAAGVLGTYIQQDMHFLAVRINEPEQVQPATDGEIEIPPLQFTCQTTRRFYPMAISRISAASETEVIIYVLADHRTRAANVPNAAIDADDVLYHPESPSLTNYETLFARTVDELGGQALITECAQWWSIGPEWADAPPEVLGRMFLTRLRTVMKRENMDTDFWFRDAASDDAVWSSFSVSMTREVSAAGLAGQPLAAMLLFGLLGPVIRSRCPRTK